MQGNVEITHTHTIQKDFKVNIVKKICLVDVWFLIAENEVVNFETLKFFLLCCQSNVYYLYSYYLFITLDVEDKSFKIA